MLGAVMRETLPVIADFQCVTVCNPLVGSGELGTSERDLGLCSWPRVKSCLLG
jgi:hypothetical protein